MTDDEMGRQHKEGWTWVLSMLAQRFASSFGQYLGVTSHAVILVALMGVVNPACQKLRA
ncbi:MAG TPA: hypothetical protein VN345_11300 [Blastocatellia bacterium]|nr:hypothetical protein [Blastocatellia bacterium]